MINLHKICILENSSDVQNLNAIQFVSKLKRISDGTLATNFRRVACDAGNGIDVKKKIARMYFVNFAEMDKHV